VVLEIASRSHLETLPGVIAAAMRDAGMDWGGVDAVAVTYGPGLASSLLVGLATAKGLALSLGRPLCAINHIEAHLYSAFLSPGAPSLAEACPFTALVVSGGHTCLVNVSAPGRYRLLGATLDDAAGEAFDKGAKLLGLGYPGGPAIDKAAKSGKPDFVRFPQGQQRKLKGCPPGLDPDLCFSFSGLKTSLRYYLRDNPLSPGRDEVASLAASYQEAIVTALVRRCEAAAGPGERLVAAGGVALNSRLRRRLADMAAARAVTLLAAEPRYCADNAAMVAGLAGTGRGVWGDEAMRLDACPSLPLA
jgi:N6-L-threonylcarbamoyladenine synthase